LSIPVYYKSKGKFTEKNQIYRNKLYQQSTDLPVLQLIN